MWLTCNNAINRFDGKNIKVYNLNKYFYKCPNLQQGYGFAEDDKSNIYIGSQEGLYVYNRNNNNFTLHKIFNNAADNIAIPIGFYNQKIYCFNRQFQIASFDVKTKKTAFVTQFDIPELASIHIYQANGNLFYSHYPFIDKNKNLFIVGKNEVKSYNLETKFKTDYPLEKRTNIFSSCYDIEKNNIFLGTKNAVLVLDIVSKKVQKITSFNRKKLSYIKSIAVSKNKIAISTGLDLVLTSKDLQSSNWINNDEYLKTAMFNHLHFDKSNKLWVCEDSKGQVVFNFEPQVLNKVPTENQKKLPFFKYPGVATISELPNGYITQGYLEFNIKTQNSGFLSSINTKESLFRTITDKYRNGVWFFYESFSKKINNRIIYFFDSSKKLKPIVSLKEEENLGNQNDIFPFANKTVLCSFSKGLFWLDDENKTLIQEKNITVSNPFKINELNKNRIAVSYTNNDMLLLEVLPNRSLKLIKKLLPKVQSFYIQEDTKRNLYWIGANDGLYLLNKNFKTIKKFDANNGLAGTYIYGLLLDAQGNVYCSHQRGLSSINAQSHKVVNFDKSDGIQDYDFNNRAFLKASDGTMYFGGANGFNYFKPPLKIESFYKPEIYIDEIFVNNKTYNPNSNPNNIKKLKLNYDENNLKINAFVKDLGNANFRELVYRIKEIDSKWTHLKNGEIINLINLAPNNYTLQIGYYDKYANKEIFQKTLYIYVDTPFYKEIWFWTLIAFATSGFIFFLFNKRKFEKQKNEFIKQLELEKQRNKITADLHDEIGSTLSSLQINSSVAQMHIDKNSNAAKEVLVTVENQAKSLGDKISDIIWSMKPGKDEFMTLSTRIKNYCNEVLGSTEINYKIEIDEEIDTIITDFSIRKNILLITKEAVNNALKYSKATNLKVIMIYENEIILVIISDNGIGFDTDKVSGNGLGNMKTRANELNARVKIISNENSGTTVQFQFRAIP